MIIPILFPSIVWGVFSRTMFQSKIWGRSYPNDRLVMVKKFLLMKAILQTNRSSYHETKSSNRFFNHTTLIWDAECEPQCAPNVTDIGPGYHMLDSTYPLPEEIPI